MASTPIFSAGGLASGLDTNSIVDKLVALESQPILKNSQRQAALSVQISAVGDLLSKIKSLASTASTLGKGLAATSITNTPTGVTAVAGTGATPGRYSISVDTVASAAKARSGQFDTANDTVAGGTLALTVQGTAYNIDIAANSDLGMVVNKINASGAPIRAAVISDGTKVYLSLTNRDTGKPIGSGVNGGLIVNSDSTGLGLAVTQDAVNAVMYVDQLRVESKSNEITTAIPGITLSVKAQQAVASDLVVSPDTGKSTTNLQGFIDQFNAIVTTLKASLRPDPKNPTADGSTVDSTTAITVQQRMNGLLSALSVEEGSYRTLADIGVKMQNDGTLKLDAGQLSAALAKDPGSVDAVFSTASTGMAARLDALSKRFTDSVDGQLVQRQQSLQKTIKDLDLSSARIKTNVEAYKVQLMRQFANMEKLISNYNSIGTFLNNSSALAVGSKK
jgi:flagellar hook-associated protein 2